MKELNTELIGHFECICHDRDHMIKAYHWHWIDDKDIHEIDFDFVINYGDWEANKDCYTDISWIKEHIYDAFNFFRRINCRIKIALRILVIGHIPYNGEWIANERSFDEMRKWINQTNEIIKKQNGRLA